MMLWCSRCGRVLAVLPGAFSEHMQQFEGTACSECGRFVCDSCNPPASQGGTLACTGCTGRLDPVLARDVEAIHGKHRKAIDAWCDRVSVQPIRVEIGNRSALTAGSVREDSPGGPLFFELIADGPLLRVEESVDHPGMLAFEFDSHLRGSSEYDRFTLGYEMSGVEDHGERLVIAKGSQVLRLVAHPSSPDVLPIATPGPGATSGTPPAGHTIERHAACGGAGCELCDGHGRVLVAEPARVCTTCRGNGYLIMDELFVGPICEACQGTGWSGAVSPQEVTGAAIPPGGELDPVAASVAVGIFSGHTDSIQSFAVSPDGAWIVSAAGGYPEPGALKVWSVETGSCLHTIPGQTTPVSNPLAVSPDGTWFASAGGSMADRAFVLRTWDVATGTCRHSLIGHTQWVKDCAIAPDGTWLVSASNDGSLRVWDVATGTCTSLLLGHDGAVYTCTVSPDGTLIVSTGADGTVRAWDVATGACRRTLRGHDGEVHALAVSPDSRWAVSAGGDETLRIWDIATGTCRHVLTGHTDALFHVSVSPDGRWIVSGSSPVMHGKDLDLRVWDPATGSCLHVLRGHTGWVTDVAVSPDGRWIVSASRDETVRIWDPATGTCLRSLVGHDGGVACVAVSPDSAWVVSGGYDQTLRTWDVATGTCRLPQGSRGATRAVLPLPVALLAGPNVKPPVGRGGVRGLLGRLRRPDASGSSAPGAVTLVRSYSETKTEPTTGATGVLFYEVYSARTADAARTFLEGKVVTERLHYLLVETPEGNWGRDINGIYRE